MLSHEFEAQLRQGIVAIIRNRPLGEIRQIGRTTDQEQGQPRAPSFTVRRAMPLVASTRDLLQTYSSLCGQVMDVGKPHVVSQVEDSGSKELLDIDSNQGEMVKNQLRERLHGSRSVSRGAFPSETSPSKVAEVSSHLIGHVADGQGLKHDIGSEEIDKISWTAVAERAKRGVRHLVKHLPE